MEHRGRTVLAMDCVLAGAETHHGRPLNSVVRLHVEAPTLEFTSAARQALLDQMAIITQFQPIPIVIFDSDPSFGETPPSVERVLVVGSHWTIGYTDLSKVSAEAIFLVDGIPFVFGGERSKRYLDGVTLDFIGGAFVFERRAI